MAVQRVKTAMSQSSNGDAHIDQVLRCQVDEKMQVVQSQILSSHGLSEQDLHLGQEEFQDSTLAKELICDLLQMVEV